MIHTRGDNRHEVMPDWGGNYEKTFVLSFLMSVFGYDIPLLHSYITQHCCSHSKKSYDQKSHSWKNVKIVGIHCLWFTKKHI